MFLNIEFQKRLEFRRGLGVMLRHEIDENSIRGTFRLKKLRDRLLL